jgi:SprT protein
MVVDAPFGKRNFCRDQGVVVVNTRPMKESDSNHSAEGERIASAARTLGDGEGLQGRVVAHTLTLLQAAAQRLGVKTPDPQIRFDLRGRVAGQVRFGSRGPWVIRYNPVLMQANAEDFLSTTVPHEVAHLVAYAKYGLRIRPHGPEWRSVMHFYGVVPERCHRYDLSDVSGRALRQFDYHCSCRDHRLSSIRHHRVQAGRAYICRRCATPLRPGRHPDAPV